MLELNVLNWFLAFLPLGVLLLTMLDFNWRNIKTTLETSDIPLAELPKLVEEVEVPASD